jgi:hypothetical protein
MLKDDYYKVGMTLCKDEATLRAYLRRRYGTAYGCCVHIMNFKQVGNPRIAEKHVHAQLKDYCKGGEMYCCDKNILQDALDSIPDTEEIVIKNNKLLLNTYIKKCSNIPHDFIDIISFDDASNSNHIVKLGYNKILVRC